MIGSYTPMPAYYHYILTDHPAIDWALLNNKPQKFKILRSCFLTATTVHTCIRTTTAPQPEKRKGGVGRLWIPVGFSLSSSVSASVPASAHASSALPLSYSSRSYSPPLLAPQPPLPNLEKQDPGRRRRLSALLCPSLCLASAWEVGSNRQLTDLPCHASILCNT